MGWVKEVIDDNELNTLSAVKEKHGIRFAETIYNFAPNQLIRGEDPELDYSIHGTVHENRNIDMIFPGDIVFIPPKMVFQTNAQQANLFVTDGIAELPVEVLRVDLNERPYFQYADGEDNTYSACPSGNRFVLYWLYAEGGELLSSTINWADQGLLLPQGIENINYGKLVGGSHPIRRAFEGASVENNTFTPYFKYRIQYNPYLSISDYYLESLVRGDYETGPVRPFNFGQMEIGGTHSAENIDNDNDDYYNGFPVDLRSGVESGDFRRSKTPSGLFSGKEYGFLLMPPDMGPFITKPFKDLVEMPVMELDTEGELKPKSEAFVATKVLIEDKSNSGAPYVFNEQVIKIHCPLPEWDYRLRQAVGDLEDELKKIETLMAAEMRQIMLLDKMKKLTETARDFPYKNASPSYLYTHPILELEPLLREWMHAGDIDEMITNLGDLKDGINENIPFQMIAGKKVPRWSAINNSAIKLWELLQSEAFSAELIRYVKEYEENGGYEEGAHQKGPYTIYEPNWTQIFTTLERCYKSLALTELKNDVYDKHIKPLHDLIIKDAGEPDISDSELQEIHDEFFSEVEEEEFKNFSLDEWKKIISNATTDDEPEDKTVLYHMANITKRVGLTIFKLDALAVNTFNYYGYQYGESVLGANLTMSGKRAIRQFKAFQTIRGIMKRLNGGNISKNQETKLVRALLRKKSRVGHLGRDAESLKDLLFQSNMTNDAGKRFVANYNKFSVGVCTVFAIADLYLYFHNKEFKVFLGEDVPDELVEEDWVHILEIVNGIGKTLNTGVSVTSASFKVASLFSSAKIFTTSFTPFFAYLGMAQGAVTIAVGIGKYGSNDDEKTRNAVLGGISSICMGLGALLIATPAGWILMGVGLLLMFAPAIIEFFENLLQTDVQKLFEELWDSFCYFQIEYNNETLVLKNRYITFDKLDKLIDRINRLKSISYYVDPGVDWKPLSYKAIVPMMLNDFSIENISRITVMPRRHLEAQDFIDLYERKKMNPENIEIADEVIYYALKDTWNPDYLERNSINFLGIIRNRYDELKELVSQDPEPDGLNLDKMNVVDQQFFTNRQKEEMIRNGEYAFLELIKT